MPDGYLTDDHSIKLLLDRVTVLQREIYDLIGETEQSDPPTGNKLQDLAYSVDKNLWQLRAHLQRPSSPGRSTLVQATGKRTFGPLSAVPWTIVPDDEVVRVGQLRAPRRAHKERLTPITTAHQTPARLPSWASRNDLPGPLA